MKYLILLPILFMLKIEHDSVLRIARRRLPH